jgi:hypothetical protein
MGTQTFHNFAGQSMRSELRVVRKAESIASLNVADVCNDDSEQIYSEDKLGCARGIVYAIAFQIAIVAVPVLGWKLMH